MEACLYGQGGFYSSGVGIAGRRGDFITSPEVGPLFGAVLARRLDDAWVSLGNPDPFLVIDAGTGPGTLLKSLELAAPACAEAWQLLGVDRATGVELPESLDGAVVVANELLDNLVVRIVERGADGWLELHVVPDPDDGRPVESLEHLDAAEADDLLARVPDLDRVAVGGRLPVHHAARAWVREVLDRGASGLIAFDYGAPSTLELVERGGWLRTYRGHERGDDPFAEPGAWDITVDIGFDQLPPKSRLVPQAEWLGDWGIDELVAEGRAYWDAHAAAPDLAAMRMRSRVNEAAALTDPSGLGGWWVAEWWRRRRASQP